MKTGLSENKKKNKMPNLNLEFLITFERIRLLVVSRELSKIIERIVIYLGCLGIK